MHWNLLWRIFRIKIITVHSGLGIQTNSDRICLDSQSLKMSEAWSLKMSRYLNSDNSYQNLDTEAPWYPYRGGAGLGIQTS